MNQKIDFKDAAVTMELKMRSFYVDMSRKVKSPESRDLLLYLADEELEHSRFVEALAQVETNTEVLNRAFASAGDIMGYLQGDILARVRMSYEFEDEIEILRFAARSEEDAKLFYSKILECVDDPGLMEQVRTLMEFEDQHISRINVILNLLLKKRKS